ncbi:MAG: carbon storage regulator, partial [Planctomycetaceae bacterium]|nr:carbon storage regulator [Planctomycetaceae bacterium]
MLVLTRGEGESIAIGPDIVITVCRVRENRVRIGLTVPDDVRVLRSE